MGKNTGFWARLLPIQGGAVGGGDRRRKPFSSFKGRKGMYQTTHGMTVA